MVGGDALDCGHDDIAGLLVGLVARLALDGSSQLDGVVLGLLADRLEEQRLGVLGGHLADRLEGGDLLLVGLRYILASSLELALAVEQLAIALLEHVGALVELLVALEEATFKGAHLRAAAARLILGLALHPELLVLRLEDQLLLACARFGLDATSFGMGRFHRLRGPHPARDHAERGSADSGNDGHRDDDR